MQIMQNAEHFVISTRVSARETNNIYKYIKGWKCNFNSRLRKETNYHAGYISRNVDHISIHVSARRRTLLPLLLPIFDFAFQFTSPQGDEHFRNKFLSN